MFCLKSYKAGIRRVLRNMLLLLLACQLLKVITAYFRARTPSITPRIGQNECELCTSPSLMLFHFLIDLLGRCLPLLEGCNAGTELETLYFDLAKGKGAAEGD